MPKRGVSRDVAVHAVQGGGCAGERAKAACLSAGSELQRQDIECSLLRYRNILTKKRPEITIYYGTDTNRGRFPAHQ